MRRWLVFGVIVGVGSFSMAVSGFQGQAKRAVLPDPIKVKDNLYMIAASNPQDNFTGGNTGVFITDKGVVVVDTKLAGYGQGLLDKIRTVTDKPVITIINTHTHGDHTGSNEGFPATVDIVTHENTKTNMTKMDAFQGDKAKFLPKRTYKDRLTLFSGKDRVELYHFGAGHTNGDTFVLFPALRVLQTGDMFAWKGAPFVDRSTGGSGVAFPDTLAKLLSSVKDFDTVIPGHAPVLPRKDLEEFQRYTADMRDAIRTTIKSGQGPEQAMAAVGKLADKYPGYTTNMFLKGSVEAVFAEMK